MSENNLPPLRVIAARMAGHYTRQGDCMIWANKPNAHGYGLFGYKGKQYPAHRMSLALSKGEHLPEQVMANHACGNRACVNPMHLNEMSARQNSAYRTKVNSNNKTGVRGVVLTSGGKYRVRVIHKGKEYAGGTYATLGEASEIAEQLRALLHD